MTIDNNPGKALGENQRRYEAIFAQAPLGIAVIDSQTGRFLEVNPRYCQIVGRTLEEMLRLDFQAITHPDDLRDDPDLMRRLTTGEISSIQFEKRYIHKDGSIVWGRLTVVMMSAGEQSHSHHLAMVEDITEQRKTRSGLDRLFQLSEELLCVAGFDGYFKQLNPAWERTLGHTTEELLRSPWLDFVHPDDREATIGAGNQLTDGSKVLSFENRYRCRDGSYKWLSWLCVPVVEEKLIYAAARDMTDRKEADESRSRLVAIVESTEDAVYGVTLDGIITDWNRAAERMYGYTASEAIGRPIVFLVPLERQEEEKHMLRRIGAGERIEPFETQRVTKDGRVVDVLLTVSPIRDGQDRLVGVSKVAHNITARKQADELLRKRQAELNRVSHQATMTELAAQIAHEINQPLAAIAAYTQGSLQRLRQRRKVTVEIIDAMEKAVAQAHRAADIIRRLRKLSRRHETTRIPRNLNALVREAAMLASETKRAGKVSLEFSLEENLPEVSVDGVQIEQVVVNLVTNAIDAVSLPGLARRQVKIQTRRGDAGDLIVSVRDSGAGLVGIEPDRLFEPFITTKPQGLGMGLSICRTIVEAHGGRLQATSNPEGGMTFQFNLPHG